MSTQSDVESESESSRATERKVKDHAGNSRMAEMNQRLQQVERTLARLSGEVSGSQVRLHALETNVPASVRSSQSSFQAVMPSQGILSRRRMFSLSNVYRTFPSRPRAREPYYGIGETCSIQ